MGIHTGRPIRQGSRFIGIDVHRAARIAATAHGGQVVLSEEAATQLQRALPDGVSLLDLGRHRLKDLDRPERIYQLVSPDLRAEFPPLKTLESRPTNVPVELTSMIGRPGEVQAVCALLRDPAVRLVTLTGPGGTGKSRLAIHAARQLLGDFADGITFVGLAPVTDATAVPAAIGRALNVREFPNVPVMETVKTTLQDREALLLIDNFEHVLSAAPLIAALLQACRRLKVLVTSRIVLRLSAERELRVPGLGLPDPRRPQTVEQLMRCDAVLLFVERTRAVRADFTLTSDTASAVAAICTRLDGLPLAIELAAARTRVLTPDAIQRRLESRLSLLGHGPVDLPERQQTLHAAIAWSHDLLNSEEQALFRRLTVFADPFTLDAVDQVCGGLDGRADLIDVTESLVASSLLQPAASDGSRLMMLETIREFAGEKLREAGEGDLMRERHLNYFLEAGQATAPKLRTTEMRGAVRFFLDQQEDLLVALEWARTRRPEAAATLEETMRSFRLFRAYLAVW